MSEGAARFNPLSPEWKIIMETKDKSESNSKELKTKAGTKSASKAREVKGEAVPKEKEEKQPKDIKGKGSLLVKVLNFLKIKGFSSLV